MTSILMAVAVVAGIGLIAGVGLAVAAIVMHVPVDELVEKLTGALPGANCGAAAMRAAGLTPKPWLRARPRTCAPPEATAWRKPWRKSWAWRRRL